MKTRPITHEGYKLFHNGSIAFAQMEANGLKIDTEYLQRAIRKTNRKIERVTSQLKRYKLYNVWRKQYGGKTNLGSTAQLGNVIFNIAKIATGSKMEKSGNYKANADALEDINHPFVKKYRQLTKLNTTRNTFLASIERHTGPDGFMHPVYNLHIARSMRGSCNDPNGQNFPVRNEEMAGLVRPCFVPRAADRQFCEIDFSGAEVKTSVCYNKDPQLLKYIEDKTTDMHRDMGMQCFKLKQSQMTKAIRGCAKGDFVFAQFYGSWYLNCAKSLYKNIDKDKLRTADGTPLKRHLRNKGIKSMGDCAIGADPLPNTFEKHIKEVEHDFWKRRFKVYDQWKNEWWEEYLLNGYFDTLTGFRISGVHDKKQACNYPIQGSAFHCLLWCLIRVQKLLQKYRMKTLLTGQIHDSIIADIAKGELRDYVEIAQKVMTVDLRKHYPWLIVPMEVEVEVAPPGESWLNKQQFEL